jgi:hypothetical protein
MNNCCQDTWDYPKQDREFVNLTTGQTWMQISQNTLTNVPLAKREDSSILRDQKN